MPAEMCGAEALFRRRANQIIPIRTDYDLLPTAGIGVTFEKRGLAAERPEWVVANWPGSLDNKPKTANSPCESVVFNQSADALRSGAVQKIWPHTGADPRLAR
ncbi:MAG TPA: hypothetical protein VJM09_09340 [Sphingobium sp.]|nr:hypothetical protein [Sphingobium sp.]